MKGIVGAPSIDRSPDKPGKNALFRCHVIGLARRAVGPPGQPASTVCAANSTRKTAMNPSICRL